MAYPANLTLPYPDFVSLKPIKKAEVVADYTEIQNWVMAAVDKAAGHDHSAGDNKGPQIPTAGVADLAITAPKIGDGQVTAPKLAGTVGTHAWGKSLGSIAYKRVTLGDVPTVVGTAYTVPVGKKALVSGAGAYNSTAGDITLKEYRVPSGGVAGSENQTGSYYIVAGGQSASYNAGAALLPEGATIQVIAGAAGISAAWMVVEMDASEGLVGVFGGNLLAGDNTVYTCPVGKSAKLYRDVELQSTFLFNPTAAAVNALPKVLPSGGVAVTLGNKSVSANTGISLFVVNANLTLSAGDALIVNASAAGVNFWAVIVEV